jgi:hypothetical protein
MALVMPSASFNDGMMMNRAGGDGAVSPTHDSPPIGNTVFK